MDEENRFKAHYTNTLEDSKRVIHRLENFMVDHAISFSIINKLLMCVDEIVTNIVTHAYKDKEEHTVYLESKLENGFITIEFRDDGVAFDPTKRSGPDTTLSIEDRDIGGLGLHLVKKLMDKMEYAREGDYNVLKITKKIQ
ncbi:MAG: ATP-binding protein [Gammaproteobacteria bacterium]